MITNVFVYYIISQILSVGDSRHAWTALWKRGYWKQLSFPGRPGHNNWCNQVRQHGKIHQSQLQCMTRNTF